MIATPTLRGIIKPMRPPRIGNIRAIPGLSVSNGAAYALNLTPAALAPGDLVIVFSHSAGSAVDPLTTSAGWSDSGLGDVVNTTQAHRMRCAYKFMGATPDTSIAFPGTGSASYSASVIGLALSGAASPMPFTATPRSATGVSAVTPPSITPIDPDCLIVCAGGALMSTGCTLAGYVASYTSTPSAGAGSSSLGEAYNLLTGGAGVTQTPGAFGGGFNATNYWVAMTLALKHN
jgi:hypothetical protein